MNQTRAPRLLLVCDEKLMGELLLEMLQRAGYLPALAFSLEEGRQRFATDVYDLVVVNVSDNSDAAMDFCNEIKRSSPAQTVAFLAGRWTYIPPDSCPDAVLPKDEGPEELLTRLAEITTPPPLRTPPTDLEPGLS